MFEPFEPEDVRLNMSKGVLRSLFEQIRKGPGDGRRYSPATQSNDAVAKVIANFAGIDRPKLAQRIAKAWLDKGILLRRLYKHPAHGKEVACIEVGDALAAKLIEVAP